MQENNKTNPLKSQVEPLISGFPRSELSTDALLGTPRSTPVEGRLSVERSTIDCGKAFNSSKQGQDDVFVPEGEQTPFNPSLNDRNTGGAEVLSDGSVSVNVGESDVFPSLVNNGQSRTSNTIKGSWSRKQKRVYRNLLSWLFMRIGKKCQILRVDLTSASGKKDNLTEDFKKLRRIVENTFKYKIEYFKIETYEGNGVLHMVWAIQYPSAVWIPQKWLSRTWENITGAHRVWISRMGAKRGHDGRYYKVRSSDSHAKSIASYMASQYLASQSAIKRVSWSWWRNDLCLVKTWQKFTGMCRQGLYVQGVGLTYTMLKRWELFKGWGELLMHGSALLGDRMFSIEGHNLFMRKYEYTYEIES